MPLKTLLLIGLAAGSGLLFITVLCHYQIEPVAGLAGPYLDQAKSWVGGTLGGVTEGLSEGVGAAVNQYKELIPAAVTGGAGVAAAGVQRWWNNRQLSQEKMRHEAELFAEQNAFSELAKLKTTLEIKNGEMEAQLEKLAGADKEAEELRAKLEALQKQNDKLTAERNAFEKLKVEQIAEKAEELRLLEKVVE